MGEGGEIRGKDLGDGLLIAGDGIGSTVLSNVARSSWPVVGGGRGKMKMEGVLFTYYLFIFIFIK